MPDDPTPPGETPIIEEVKDEQVSEPESASDAEGQEPKFDAAYVRKLRQEAAANRKIASELKAKIQEHENAKLSEIERATKHASELEAQLATAHAEAKDANLVSEITSACLSLGVIDPEAATALLKPRLTEESDVKEALADLLKEKPYLKAQAKPAAASGGSPANPSSEKAKPGNGLSPEQLQSMSKAELSEFSAEEIAEALAGSLAA